MWKTKMKVNKKTKNKIIEFIREYIEIKNSKDIDFSNDDYDENDFDIMESIRCIWFHLQDIGFLLYKGNKFDKLIDELWK